MPDSAQRPYLSDAINYDVDIEPHQFIKIYAGVGSGKTPSSTISPRAESSSTQMANLWRKNTFS